MARGFSLRSSLSRFGPYTLAALIWRGDMRCTWCHRRITRETYCIDHVVPRVQGGADDASNVVLACRPCNLERYSVNEIPRRAVAAGRSVRTCFAEVRRQTSIPVGKCTAANASARGLAERWFGSAIATSLRAAAAHRRRRAEQLQGDDFPFGFNERAA